MTPREHGPLYQLTVDNGLLIIAGVALTGMNVYQNVRSALVQIQSDREDRRLERAENKSAHWADAINRYLDGIHLGEVPDNWSQE